MQFSLISELFSVTMLAILALAAPAPESEQLVQRFNVCPVGKVLRRCERVESGTQLGIDCNRLKNAPGVWACCDFKPFVWEEDPEDEDPEDEDPEDDSTWIGCTIYTG